LNIFSCLSRSAVGDWAHLRVGALDAASRAGLRHGEPPVADCQDLAGAHRRLHQDPAGQGAPASGQVAGQGTGAEHERPDGGGGKTQPLLTCEFPVQKLFGFRQYWFVYILQEMFDVILDEVSYFQIQADNTHVNLILQPEPTRRRLWAPGRLSRGLLARHPSPGEESAPDTQAPDPSQRPRLERGRDPRRWRRGTESGCSAPATTPVLHRRRWTATTADAVSDAGRLVADQQRVQQTPGEPDGFVIFLFVFESIFTFTINSFMFAAFLAWIYMENVPLKSKFYLMVSKNYIYKIKHEIFENRENHKCFARFVSYIWIFLDLFIVIVLIIWKLYFICFHLAMLVQSICK